jgi:hypothetical protein
VLKGREAFHLRLRNQTEIEAWELPRVEYACVCILLVRCRLDRSLYNDAVSATEVI